jgi:TATA-box binding protein (TBP) (component of TFIID and TFIIIB)
MLENIECSIEEQDIDVKKQLEEYIPNVCIGFNYEMKITFSCEECDSDVFVQINGKNGDYSCENCYTSYELSDVMKKLNEDYPNSSSEKSSIRTEVYESSGFGIHAGDDLFVMLWKSGKAQIMGEKSSKAINKDLELIDGYKENRLKPLYDKFEDFKVVGDLRINNLVYSRQVDSSLVRLRSAYHRFQLDTAPWNLCTSAEYEPEQFPALQLEWINGCKIAVFSTGKINIVGFDNLIEAVRAYNQLKACLEKVHQG